MNRLLFLLITFIIASCTTVSQSNEVEVSSAGEVQAIGMDANIYSFNIEESKVTWIGSKPAGKHFGTINFKEGHLAFENGIVSGGKAIIDLNTILATDLIDDTEKHDRLVNHLKSDDFFDVDNYPEAIFEIIEVNEYDPEQAPVTKEEFETDNAPASPLEHRVKQPTHSITGNLTMRDTTLSISFPAAILFSENTIEAKAKFNINRVHWNLKYRDEASVADKTKDRFIYNTVNVGFELKATKKEATDNNQQLQ